MASPGPGIAGYLLKDTTWRIPTEEKVVYLTFDDGPIPGVTPIVLDTLAHYNAMATFFCVGDNVRKHPDIYRSLIDAGHTTGNHTMHHLKGWKTDNEEYFNDVDECAEYVDSNLFRPPYGKLSLSQLKYLRKSFRVVFWDVLSRDYDARLSPQECAANVCRHAGPGSIIVFHDSIKAQKRLAYALPYTLLKLSQEGYSFRSIPVQR